MTGGKVVRAFLLLLLTLIVAPLLSSVTAAEATDVNKPEPGWAIDSAAFPSRLERGHPGVLFLLPLNVGAAATSGPVQIVDTLPPGITATDAGAGTFPSGNFVADPKITHSVWECGILPGGEANSVVTCTNSEENLAHVTGGAGFPTLALPEQGHPDRQPNLAVAVEVSPGAQEGAVANHVTISGGGAATVTSSASVLIGSLSPSFGVSHWQGWFSNADGTPDTRAGSVPYAFATSLDLNTLFEEGNAELFTNAGGELRSVAVKLPAGLVGNPRAVPYCPRTLFSNPSECPQETKLGVIKVFTKSGADLNAAVYNFQAPRGVPAEFAFSVEKINTRLDPSVRTGGDYGIDTHINDAPQKEVIGSLLTLWGVPNDPTHEPWRAINLQGCLEGELRQGDAQPGRLSCYLGPHPTLKPFLRMPTSCTGPLAFSISANGWLRAFSSFTEPLTFFTHDAEGTPVGLTGCNQLPFEPTISAKPTTNVADAPTGLEFDLHIPQPEVVNAREEEVEGQMETVGAEPALHEADLKDAVVTLPKGVAVNPASANGLGACSAAQFGLTSPIGATPITTTPGPAQCPDASKIGTVEAISPLLDHPVGNPNGPEGDVGAVYVAAPKDNPFNSLLAIYIVLEDPQTGTIVKLASKVTADPVTGQLTTTLTEAPQLPVEEFKFNFFKGAGAALRTPQTCGKYETTTDMTPWSTPEGADATPGDSFELTQSPSGGVCPTSEAQLPNAPTFSAGTITPKAGAYSPFVLHLARQDGSQELKSIDTTLPAGLIGKLAGVGECSEAQIAQANSRNKFGDGALERSSPSCPLSSEVGTVNVGAGAGPSPYYVQGHAYLAGPYKGAPLSLEIITPAVAGPYDLGAVAVRTALYVNSETTQIHAVSDELPHILQGIPLDVRSINLEMGRPDFTLNPTSCAAKTVLGSATSVLNQGASLSSPFQVGECSKLGFKPKLSIKLKGSTKRAGTPALRATLTYPKGAYSNVASASVALPHSEFLDQAHIKTICTRVQFAEGNTPGERCPPGSIYGHARAITPLLDQPLEGPVYLRSSSHPLPDLVAALNGQIQVVLDSTIDSVHGGIRNRFEMVPDAPVSKFTLTMQGGKKGLLVNSTNLCKSTNKATVDLTAQNGKTYDTEPVVGNSCKKKHGKGKKKASRRVGSSHR